MTYNFPYLQDAQFLQTIDNLHLKQQFVKIIILDFKENPIQQIQGKVTGGGFSLDGSSGMRRTGTISLITDNFIDNLKDTKHLLSINKKVQILIGFANTTDQYTQYPIIWFPQGIFVIISPNITHNNNGTVVSLTLHDKMALLNGQCGGTFPASINFHEIQDVDENGQIVITTPTIYQIIQQLVNHFGGQQLGKIIISDVPNRIKQIVKWTGSSPIYCYKQPNEDYYSFGTNYESIVSKVGIENKSNIKTFYYGDDIGYILTDFVYPGELIGNAGETVTTILDKIKTTLGNYQYFYDINGNFRFQEIKNYLNNSYSSQLLQKLNEDGQLEQYYNTIDNLQASNYLVDYNNTKSVYTFDNANIITAYTNNPQYQQIKNDFVIWGKRVNSENSEIPIRYHLAIDSKPSIGNKYKVFFFTDPEDGLLKAKVPTAFENINKFPTSGEANIYYLDSSSGKIYKWNTLDKVYEVTDYTLKEIQTKDFRTELYLSGVASEPYGLNSNYYYAQLQNEWNKIYDVENGKFFQETLEYPSEIDFFLDFIDSSAAISQFSVQNIGRRTKTISDDSINCLFEPYDVNDVVLIELGTSQTNDLQQECASQGQNYSQVSSEIYSLLAMGGSLKSAYQEIRKELYQYTNYNQQISLTVLPIYYLQPNTRITVIDNQSGINGDYIIKTISMPLDTNGTMNLSCTKALERI